MGIELSINLNFTIYKVEKSSNINLNSFLTKLLLLPLLLPLHLLLLPLLQILSLLY